ncbi:MAG: HAMP domain-containing protein [Oscillospiraceae bacterium]|nr:HAMP domain-containing protein [Oscillospiraceae bacterium]
MFKNLKIKTQFLLAFGILVAIMVVYGAVSILSVGSLTNALTAAAQSGAAVAGIDASVEKAQTLRAIVPAVACVSLLVAIGLGVGMTRSFVSTIEELKEASEAISRGNLDYSIGYRADSEFGELADSMRTTAANLENIITDTKYLVEELGAGNFIVESRHADSYVGDYNGIVDGIYSLRDHLVGALTKIDTAADGIGFGSNGALYGAQALSQVATEQAAAIQELAATLNEINSNAGNAGEFAAQASEKTSESGILMDKCKAQMDEMLSAMNDINSTSEEIGKIIKTIEDIAFQTNILALNAAVEAARAGAAGKGFAVVADEVRNLAAKSAEASKNSSALIEASLASVARGVKLANGTAQQLSGVTDSSQAVMEMVSRIAMNAQEQSVALQQVTTGIDQISDVVQTISSVAEQSANGSKEMTDWAQDLKNVVGGFVLTDKPVEKKPAFPGAPEGEAHG